MGEYISVAMIVGITMLLISIGIAKGNFQMVASFLLIFALSGAIYCVNLLDISRQKDEELEWKRLYFLTLLITILLAGFNYAIIRLLKFPFPTAIVYGSILLPIFLGMFTIRITYLIARPEEQEKFLTFPRQFMMLLWEDLVVLSVLLASGIMAKLT